MNYILITPVRNEENNIPKLVECVIKQTILPILWIIINNDSNDNTPKLLSSLEKEFNFIHILNQDYIEKSEGHLNFSITVKKAYDFAIALSNSLKINYDYVGKLDADIIIPKDFFEKLIMNCKNDSKIGVASGKMLHYDPDNNSKNKNEKYFSDEISDERIYKKQFLEQIGGFPITKYSPDTVMLAKARINGWKIITYDNIDFYHVRHSFPPKRKWKSSVITGESKYYLNYSPLLFFLGFIYLLTQKPFYPALAMLYGYLNSILKRKEKIKDESIREYFWNDRIKEFI